MLWINEIYPMVSVRFPTFETDTMTGLGSQLEVSVKSVMAQIPPQFYAYWPIYFLEVEELRKVGVNKLLEEAAESPEALEKIEMVTADWHVFHGVTTAKLRSSKESVRDAAERITVGPLPNLDFLKERNLKLIGQSELRTRLLREDYLVDIRTIGVTEVFESLENNISEYNTIVGQVPDDIDEEPPDNRRTRLNSCRDHLSTAVFMMGAAVQLNPNLLPVMQKALHPLKVMGEEMQALREKEAKAKAKAEQDGDADSGDAGSGDADSGDAGSGDAGSANPADGAASDSNGPPDSGSTSDAGANAQGEAASEGPAPETAAKTADADAQSETTPASDPGDATPSP